MSNLRGRTALAALLTIAACSSSPTGERVSLPGGNPGIGFDDLRYSASLHRVLVPAGRTGTLDLVDPDTLDVTSIAGFGTATGYSGGHEDGPTSVDERKRPPLRHRSDDRQALAFRVERRF